MELFFILMLIGVVGVFLYTGSTAVFGKVIGPLIVIVFILGMCAHEKNEMDKEEEERKEWNKNFQERLRREDDAARKIRIDEMRKSEERARECE